MILKLLSGTVMALVRCVRPTSAVTRILFVASGAAMVLCGVGAARDGCPRAAAILCAAGLFLVLLRKVSAPAVRMLSANCAAPAVCRYCCGTGMLSANCAAPAVQVDRCANCAREPSTNCAREPSANCVPTFAGAPALTPASRLRVGWCQRTAARDRSGRDVFPRESAAVSWSLPGAIAASLDPGTPEWTAYLGRLGQVLEACGASLDWFTRWNDDPSRTQADVVAAAETVERSVS